MSEGSGSPPRPLRCSATFYLGNSVRIVVEEDRVKIEYFDEEYRQWTLSVQMTIDELEHLVKRVIGVGRILKSTESPKNNGGDTLIQHEAILCRRERSSSEKSRR